MGGDSINKKLYVKQEKTNDCGIACLLMILKYYNVNTSYGELSKKFRLTKNGVSAYDIIKVAQCYNLKAKGVRVLSVDILNQPFIAHIITEEDIQHFVVVKKIMKDKVLLMDPASGVNLVSKEDFLKAFSGIAILFELQQQIIPSLKENKWLILKMILLTFLWSAFSIVFSYSFSLVMKILLNNEKMNLLVFVLIFSFVGITKELIFLYRSNVGIKFRTMVENKVTKPVINRIFHLPNRFYQSCGAGELLSKINDLSFVKEMLVKIYLFFFVDVILIIIILGLSLFIKPSLFLFNIAILGITCFFTFLINPKINGLTYNVQVKYEYFSKTLEDILKNILTVKSFHKEKYFTNKISMLHDRVVKSVNFANKAYAKRAFLMGNIMWAVDILIIVYCILNKLPLNVFAFIYSIEGIFITSLENIANLQENNANFKSAMKRIKAIFNDTLMEISEPVMVNKMEVKNLSFEYDGKKVLKNVSLKISKGEKIMITGPSGAGKSTLLKIISGFIETDLVYVNNTKVDYKTLFNSVTYVDQKIKTFAIPIKENISFGEKLDDLALKTSLVDQLVLKNNLDYNYLIDQTNNNLSGGQLQKIIIASALQNGTNFIIFDETMNQLDIKTERKIVKNIISNYKDKTVIIVSHRGFNKDLFDRIITLENGMIKRRKHERIKK